MSATNKRRKSGTHERGFFFCSFYFHFYETLFQLLSQDFLLLFGLFSSDCGALGYKVFVFGRIFLISPYMFYKLCFCCHFLNFLYFSFEFCFLLCGNMDAIVTVSAHILMCVCVCVCQMVCLRMKIIEN